MFVNSFDALLASEKAEATKYLSVFDLIFDGCFDEQSIDASIKATREFLEFITVQLNLSYAYEDYVSINEPKAASTISKELTNIKALTTIQAPSEMLYVLSKNPFDKVVKYFNTFSKLNVLIEDKHRLFSASVDTESKNKIAEHKTNIETKLGTMEKQLKKIGGSI